jgi:sugar lactone lactonase YvrE
LKRTIAGWREVDVRPDPATLKNPMHSTLLTLTGAIARGGRLFLLALAVGTAACGSGGSGDEDGGGDDGGDDGGGEGDGGFEQPPLANGVATLAGYSTPGNVDGSRNQALFSNPVNVVVTSDGDVLVADHGNSLIRRVSPDGDVSSISGAPAEGMFVRPFGMVISGGDLFIQTDGNSLGQPGGALWKMPVGGGTPVLLRDNLGRTRGMAVLPDGRLVLADYLGHTLRIYSPSNGTLTPLAGQEGATGEANGNGAEARFHTPYDVVVFEGDILVTDFGNNRIRRVTLAGDVTHWAGTGTPGLSNGPLLDAQFNAPQGLTIDSSGNVFVTDTGNFTVRQITGGQVTQVAGDGSPGYLDSEDPMEAQIYGLEGIDIDPSGAYLYVSDGNRGEDGPYHRVRRCTLTD